MSLHELDFILPENSGMTSAFDEVKRTDPFIDDDDLEDLTDQEKTLLMSRYFTASIAHLEKRGHDKHIREIGDSLWKAIMQRRIRGIITDDIERTAIEMDFSPEYAAQFRACSDEPHTVFSIEDCGLVHYEDGHIILPVAFIEKSRNRPIEALASIVRVGSQVRDMINGRLYIDDEFLRMRALASEAHFLIEARRRYPHLVLSVQSRDLLFRYPQGLESLPHRARYHSHPTLTSIPQNPRNN